MPGAGASLDEDRETDARGLLLQEVGSLIASVIAGHERHPGLFHDRLRRRLVAHRADCGCRRPDKGEAGALAALGELRVLREETVTGVNGLGARALRGVDDPIPAEVAVLRLCGTDAEGFIGER